MSVATLGDAPDPEPGAPPMAGPTTLTEGETMHDELHKAKAMLGQPFPEPDAKPQTAARRIESRAAKKAALAEDIGRAVEKLQQAVMMLQAGGPLPTIKGNLRDARSVIVDAEKVIWDDEF